MDDTEHGLTVEEIPRRPRGGPISLAGDPCFVTDLPDLADTPLADIVRDGAGEDTMRRVAPSDGTRLLVAASFQSAI